MHIHHPSILLVSAHVSVYSDGMSSGVGVVTFINSEAMLKALHHMQG